MAIVAPEHWFLGPDQTPQRPAFTTGNAATAFIDGMAYFADLRRTLSACDGSLLIAGWRVSAEQVLNPTTHGADVEGDRFIDLVAAAAQRRCSVRALLFNVPGTQAPGPFRIWHAKENVEFALAVNAAGGEAILDSRVARVPASAHHQKLILATSKTGGTDVAYVGGIDVCLDRWDRAAHDDAPQRQRDHVRLGAVETHTASQPGWHDVQVRVAGPVVAQIWQAFRDRWNDERPPNHDPLLQDFRGRTRMHEAAPRPVPIDALAIQVNQTLPAGVFPSDGGGGEMTVARAHERAISLAQHYIYIEDQYAWPCSLVEYLEAALVRGVRVLLVVARDYDAPGLSIVAHRLRGEVVARLAKAGGDRFRSFHIERTDGKQVYVHSKVMIVDDCYASVGSANFNARSLVNDTELQLGIVDTDLVDIRIEGQPQRVCRFAHELRCALWAEHLECPESHLLDPIAAIDSLWANAPIAPSTRAHPHVVKHGLLAIDPIAEFVTTLVTEKLAHVPHVPVPAGIGERSVVKLAVDAALRGPQAALVLKFLEELLNPDLAPAIAANPIASALTGHGAKPVAHRPAPSTVDQLQLGEQILEQLRRGQLAPMVD